MRSKSGAIVPFELNAVQRRVHEAAERQLAKSGRIRILVLKARQPGISTYVEGRFYWKTTQRHGVRAFILTHRDQATNNLFAIAKARHGTITPMNQSHTAVECTLSDFYAGDWVDKLDETRIQHDERLAIAQGGAWALGRKADEQILTAADATTKFVGTHAGAISRTLLLQGVETLDDGDAPRDGMRFGLLTPRQWAQAMTVSEFANADFVGGNDLPFLKGAEPRTWLGIHWMVHTGLPGKGTATAKGMVYHKNALGYASGATAGETERPVSADITWHGDRAAHFVNNMMSGGACLIEAAGVVEIRTDDTAAIPA